MSTPAYERIPQESDHDAGPSRTEQLHPSTYYGDGPFDAPSSDDEGDHLLEKNGPRSPGAVELGRLDIEEDEGEGLVVVGTQKQRPSSLRLLIYSLVALVLLAGAYSHFSPNNLD
jgi:dipeptidyl aminopeptidase